LLLLLATPWLNPFATGPSPTVQPWLYACACATLLWLYRARLTLDLILQGWLTAAGISATIGLLQYAGLTQNLAPWVMPAGLGEAYGNLRQRNQFATLTTMGLAAALWLAGLHGRMSTGRWVWLAVVAALLAAGNAASASRTGLLQLLLLAGLFGLWGLWRMPQLHWLLAIALLVYVGASLTLPAMIEQTATGHGIWERLRQGEVGCNVRGTLWRNVLYLIGERPWTGWGWGELDYAHFMTLYPGGRFCDILDNAHNLPLQLAVELGVPAALLLCGGGAWLVWRLRPWRESDRARQVVWAVLSLILLHSMLEYPLWYGPFQTAVGLCAWLLWTSQEKAPSVAVVSRHRPWEYGLAAGLLLSTAYAAWDYHRISQIYLPETLRAEAYRDNTLEKVRRTRLFGTQARFAELNITPLTPDNAAHTNALAHELLHYSPEARVVEKLIESAVLLGRDQDAQQFLTRYRAAYPIEHAHWAARQTKPGQLEH
jgi:O-antigen ligase